MLINQLQPKLVQQFQNVIARSRLAQGYLFAGPRGAGKHELAQWLALRLFCQNVQDDQPCGQCPECQRILSGNHPDVIQVAPENQTIKVEAIRYLKQELYKSGMEGNQRVFIIQDAEKMSANASNSLLKFLEEPVSDALIILTTPSKSQILPTILSRMQVVDFHSISQKSAYDQFIAQDLSVADAELMSLLTRDLAQAKAWLADDNFASLLAGVLHWFLKILRQDLEAFVLVQTQLSANAKTQETQGLTWQLIISLYDFLLRLRYDKSRVISNPTLEKLAQAAQSTTQRQIVAQLNLVLDSQKQLRVNVSFQDVLEALTLKLLAV